MTHLERNKFLKHRDVPRRSSSERIFLWLLEREEKISVKVNRKWHHIQVNTACRVSTASTTTSTTLRSWRNRRSIAWGKFSNPSWRCFCKGARRAASTFASAEIRRSIATTSHQRSVITNPTRHWRREFSTKSKIAATTPPCLFMVMKINWWRSTEIRLSCRFTSPEQTLGHSSGRLSTTPPSAQKVNCRS